MPDTVHKKIVDNVLTAVQGITTANGYHTNIGHNVLHQIASPVIENDIVGAVVYDSEVTVDPETLGSHMAHRAILNLSIETFSQGENRKSAIHNNVADIVKALGVDLTRGDNAIITYWDGYNLRAEAANQNVIEAIINFRIEFYLDLFNTDQ